MTVGIAAISENQDIIALADKKYTTSMGITAGYELSENKKIVQLTPKCIALFAGDIQAANEILKVAKTSIQPADSVREVADKINQAFNKKFIEAINIQILQQYGLDINSFNAQQRTLDTTFVSTIMQAIANAKLGVSVIITGKDGDGPQIYVLQGKSGAIDATPIGYAAIGSGAAHATLSLIESECHAGMVAESLLYAMINAKKHAEYDPHVGHMSTLVRINDKVEFIDDKVLDEIWKVYEKSRKSISVITKRSSKIMKEKVYGTLTGQSK